MCVGSLVTLRHSSSEWRVITIPVDEHGFIELLRSSRRYPTRRYVRRREVLHHCTQRTPVYSVLNLCKSIRAWGEPPVNNTMLILDSRFPYDDDGPYIRSLMAAETWSIQELSTDAYAAATAAGADETEMQRLCGNSIPSSMLAPIARNHGSAWSFFWVFFLFLI